VKEKRGLLSESAAMLRHRRGAPSISVRPCVLNMKRERQARHRGGINLSDRSRLDRRRSDIPSVGRSSEVVAIGITVRSVMRGNSRVAAKRAAVMRASAMRIDVMVVTGSSSELLRGNPNSHVLRISR
jgi:hypothetical protein